jgi:hypothetical protein
MCLFIQAIKYFSESLNKRITSLKLLTAINHAGKASEIAQGAG